MKQIAMNLTSGVSCTLRANPGVYSASNTLTPPPTAEIRSDGIYGDMQQEVIKLGNLVKGRVYYDLRHAIYWPKGCAPALTAAMGMGGGFVPLLMMIDNGQSREHKV